MLACDGAVTALVVPIPQVPAYRRLSSPKPPTKTHTDQKPKNIAMAAITYVMYLTISTEIM